MKEQNEGAERWTMPMVKHESINTGYSKSIDKSERVTKFLELAIDITTDDIKMFRAMVEREYTIEQKAMVVKRIGKARTVLAYLKG